MKPDEDLPRHSVSVSGIVVRDDGRILAIKRADDGRWVPPGGVLELDETPFEGVVREVFEETGVKVEPERLTGVYKNMKQGVVSLAIRCRPVSGEPDLSDEATEVAWLLPSKAAEAMPEARAVRVADALRSDSPFLRIHDGTSLL
ncbi:NUDIX domain-containing protein [Actinomadura rubrisoli]|uniref:NUDIX domain-containing protein n=1 Tax=Actinomadura rubrisoli TaxID=2530368 RepID=A0A4R5APQ5_9ACTN|nr:NUDIX domain-containing protein [Actinomadura rubrisoli]TDD74831.1 NUDIX domain-containing protein [Actinomadura rubrisoli]